MAPYRFKSDLNPKHRKSGRPSALDRAANDLSHTFAFEHGFEYVGKCVRPVGLLSTVRVDWTSEKNTNSRPDDSKTFLGGIDLVRTVIVGPNNYVFLGGKPTTFPARAGIQWTKFSFRYFGSGIRSKCLLLLFIRVLMSARQKYL